MPIEATVIVLGGSPTAREGSTQLPEQQLCSLLEFCEWAQLCVPLGNTLVADLVTPPVPTVPSQASLAGLGFQCGFREFHPNLNSMDGDSCVPQGTAWMADCESYPPLLLARKTHWLGGTRVGKESPLSEH